MVKLCSPFALSGVADSSFKHNEVETAPIATLADYRSVTSSEDFSRLMTPAKRFTGKKLVFFNSTIQGGGVALMRHALIRLFRLLAGNAAVDDPDAPAVYRSIMGILQSKKYAHLAHDVKVGRLPHRDELLNTLLRKWTVALQLSIREGFEVKVTEALMKEKPVVAYRTGGIPLQIEDGLDGFLVDVGDPLHVAHHLYGLLTDADLYQRMSRAVACLYNNQEYLTVSNALRWLFLALWLLEKGPLEGIIARLKC